jgi:Transglycosylase SLT domain
LITLLFVTQSAAKLKNGVAFSDISEGTISKIVAQSSFTRGFDAQKVDDDGERELLNAGAPKWNQHSGVRAVLFHAREAELSIEHQAVLLSIVEVESGFNPIARAPTTSACGLFQFVRATGKRYDLQRGGCMDPWQNAEAGIKHYKDNYKIRVEKKVDNLEGSERVFKIFELSYYLHHDGIDATKPSDQVKSVVLKGTPFLFKVHSILDEEQKSKGNTTGTTEYLLASLHDIGGIIVTLVTELTEQFSSRKIDSKLDSKNDAPTVSAQPLPATETK